MDVLPPFVSRPPSGSGSSPECGPVGWSRRQHGRRDRTASPPPDRPADALPAVGAVVPAVCGHGLPLAGRPDPAARRDGERERAGLRPGLEQELGFVRRDSIHPVGG